MMTPQEVKTKTFPKALMGGYGMAAVDEFLDRLTEDYTALVQENAALKGKIKTLNDEIEEFKKVDSTLRATIVTAHQMADKIVAEAENKREKVFHEVENRRAELLSDAEAKAKERMEELSRQIAAEEERLRQRRAEVNTAVAAEEQRLEKARRAVAKFMEIAKSNCEEQMKIISRLEILVPVTHRMPREEHSEKAAEAGEIRRMDGEETPKAETAIPTVEAPAEAAAEEKAPSLEETAVFTIPGRREAKEEPVMSHPVEIPTPVAEEKAADAAAPSVEERISYENNRLKEMEHAIRATVELLEKETDASPVEDMEATRVLKLDELQFGRNNRNH